MKENNYGSILLALREVSRELAAMRKKMLFQEIYKKSLIVFFKH